MIRFRFDDSGQRQIRCLSVGGSHSCRRTAPARTKRIPSLAAEITRNSRFSSTVGTGSFSMNSSASWPMARFSRWSVSTETYCPTIASDASVETNAESLSLPARILSVAYQFPITLPGAFGESASVVGLHPPCDAFDEPRAVPGSCLVSTDVGKLRSQLFERHSLSSVHESHEFARMNAEELVFEWMELSVRIRENSINSWIHAQQCGFGSRSTRDSQPCRPLSPVCGRTSSRLAASSGEIDEVRASRLSSLRMATAKTREGEAPAEPLKPCPQRKLMQTFLRSNRDAAQQELRPPAATPGQNRNAFGLTVCVRAKRSP